MAADALRGLYETEVAGKFCVVEYEPESELRDHEQVPLLEEGGIAVHATRSVAVHARCVEGRSGDEKRRRNFLHASFLSTARLAHARRNQRRHSGVRERNRRSAERNHERSCGVAAKLPQAEDRDEPIRADLDDELLEEVEAEPDA